MTNLPRLEATPDRVAILKADRSVLEMAEVIERIDLDLSDVSATQLAKDGAGVAQTFLFDGARTDDVGVEIKNTALANALVGGRASYLERIFDAPFIKQRMRKDGAMVAVPDLSIHFRVAFPSSEARDSFVENMRGREGVLAVHREHTAADYWHFSFPPNDPFYDDQWHLQPRGEEEYGADLERAWYLESARNFRVAVNEVFEDDPNAPPLSPGIFHEDVDDNVVFQSSESFDGYPAHAIGVAGTLSAESDNEIGVAGASNNADLDVRVWETASQAANDIIGAYNAGASVINLSWGGPIPAASIEDAIEFVLDFGVIVVAAWAEELDSYPGDDCVDLIYPTAYDPTRILTVNAHDRQGNLQDIGCTSNLVDVSAPGVDIAAPYVDQFGFDAYAGVNGNPGLKGTSFAAPQVAAIAAILKDDTGLTPDQIRDVITDTAIDRGSFGFDPTYGWGTVSAFAAVAEGLERDEDLTPGSNVMVIGDINTNTGEDSGQGAGFATGTITGKDIYVLPNSDLSLQGQITLDDTRIFVLGELIDLGADLQLINGAEIFCRPSATRCDFEDVIIGNGGCIMVDGGATVRFNGNVTASNGGFMVSRGGTFSFGNNASLVIEADADSRALTLSAGSQLVFADGASATMEKLVNWIGTSSSPIVFEGDGSGTWDGLHLEGDNSALAYVEVSDATEGLDVRATGVTLDHVTATGNTYGLRTDYDACTGGACPFSRSELSVTNSTFDGNASYGLFLRNADVDLSNTTARYNSYGAYASNGLVFLHDALVSGNAYDGLRVGANADVRLGANGRPSTPVGSNRITDNGDDEIAVAAGGALYVDAAPGFGNVIAKACGPTAGEYLIDVREKPVVLAESVYWGDPSGPPSGAFYDATLVDANPYLAADPDGLPVACRSGGGKDATAELMERVHGPSAPDGSFVSGRGGEDFRAWLRERIREARQGVERGPGAPGARGLLRQLAYYQGLDRDDELGERGPTMRALERLRRRLTNGQPLPPRLRRVAEAALRAEVRDALLRAEYAAADSLLSAFGPLVLGADERRALALASVSVDEQAGRYAEALVTLQTVINTLPDGDEELAADLTLMAEAIAEHAEGGARRAATTAGKGDAASRAGSGLPAEYALEAAYPNPFGGATTLPLALPESADVRVAVYDVLGREVAVLADGELEAGRHALSLDGSRLASGVYVARAVCEGGGATRVLTGRLTLVR